MEDARAKQLLPIAGAVALLLAAIGVGVLALSVTSGDGQVEGPNEIEEQGRSVAVTYRSATVYAGSTDFYFENDDGEIIEFRVSNLQDEQKIELPDDMLESGVLDGPPGANPDLVGEDFMLLYDDRGELIRVAFTR